MSLDKSVLTVSELAISFGGIKAVDKLSFDIKEGEIFGLIGPNGAGKTTVFNCITQFYKPDTGSIKFISKNDQEIELTQLQSHEIIPLGLVRTFQNLELIRELTILDNVMIGAHVDFKSNVFEQTFQTKKARLEENAIREEAIKILDFVGISDRMYQLVGGQPYGVLKKVELARTLMCHPKLIILDEPAAGLNDTESMDLAADIKTIRDEFNCSILLVEHDMRLVMEVCDRICAINFGHMMAIGQPKEIQKNKDVQAAYLGAVEETS